MYKASDNLLVQVVCTEHSYVNPDGKQWVCKACDRALSIGVTCHCRLKLMIYNCAMYVPPEFADLNLLELRLISLRMPFMKMVALPSLVNRHGPAVNVPSKVETICNNIYVLPRLPSETDLVPLKLKRKLAYKGHYIMYDYITPQKLHSSG